MRWLNLDWDGETVFQFARADRHAAVAHDLVAQGHAYACYMTQEEIAAARAEAQAAKRPFRIDSPWRDADPAKAPAGAPHVIRLRAPRDGAATIEDRVQGAVTVQNAELDDMILLRSDSTPTYMLAVVVDDHDMGVTHVIRGDDHLNNAFRQLAHHPGRWAGPEPVYAHVPLIHGSRRGEAFQAARSAGGRGLSRRARHPARSAGQPTAAPRLGPWRRRDLAAASRRSRMVRSSSDVGRSPSRFDLKKLENINAPLYPRVGRQHGWRSSTQPLCSKPRIGRTLAVAGCDGSAASQHGRVEAACQDDLRELADGAAVSLSQLAHIDVDERAACAARRPRAASTSRLQRGMLRAMQRLRRLGALRRSRQADPQKWRRRRVSASARWRSRSARRSPAGSTSPGIFDVLALLGRDESLARLADQLRPAENEASGAG